MTTLSKWMSLVPDGTSLSAMSIPGTHDSATYVADKLPPAALALLGILGLATARIVKFVQCQSKSIEEQLNLGIRFIDLRVKYGGPDKLELYHGPVPLMLNLPDVLNVVDAFLKANPTETVLISIKNEGDGAYDNDIGTALKTQIARKQPTFYTDPKIPTLGAVRGKAVLINRISAAAGLGIYIGFPDNAYRAVTANQSDGSRLNIGIQDVYTPDTKLLDSSLTNKREAIEAGYREFSKDGFDLRIAFLSATYAPTRTPGEFADTIDTEVDTYLFTCTRGYPWITVIDYAGVYGSGMQNPISAIVSANPLTAGSAPGKDTLNAGQSLSKGQELRSSNGAYRAVFQDDGNFVVYRNIDGQVFRASNTNNKGATVAFMQNDGNFVIYAGSKALTATNTAGKGDGCRLIMQNDGNLVLYTAQGQAAWASRSSKF